MVRLDRTIGIATPVRASITRTMVRSTRTKTWMADETPPAVFPLVETEVEVVNE